MGLVGRIGLVGRMGPTYRTHPTDPTHPTYQRMFNPSWMMRPWMTVAGWKYDEVP